MQVTKSKKSSAVIRGAKGFLNYYFSLALKNNILVFVE